MNFCMIKKINFTSAFVLLVSINMAFAQFQVPTNYMPSGNINSSNTTNKPINNAKVAKREIINSSNQKTELDSLVNQRKADVLNTQLTEEDSLKKAKIAFHPFCPKSTINLTY